MDMNSLQLVKKFSLETGIVDPVVDTYLQLSESYLDSRYPFMQNLKVMEEYGATTTCTDGTVYEEPVYYAGHEFRTKLRMLFEGIDV